MLKRCQQNRHQRACQSALPQVCYLLAGAVQAGMSLEQGVRVVADEGPEPVRREFARMVALLEVGTSFTDAVTQLARWIGGDDAAMLGFALRLAHDTGGTVVASFHALAHRMYDAVRVQHRIRSLTAQGKISAIVIAALPVLILTLMWRMFPTAVVPLVTTRLGWGCVAVALLLDGIGLWWLRRMVRISL